MAYLNTLKGVYLRLDYESFPSPSEFFQHVTIAVFCEDTLFYWSHWIFHSKVLFERIHKKHHEFTSPFPLTGEYSSITEFIVGNIIPASFGF